MPVAKHEYQECKYVLLSPLGTFGGERRSPKGGGGWGLERPQRGVSRGYVKKLFGEATG